MKNKTLNLARLINILIFLNIIFLSISLNFEYWLLDIYVSFVPQILIALAFKYIVLGLLCLRVARRSSWPKLMKLITKQEKLIFGSGFLVAIYITLFSTTIIQSQPKATDHNLTVGTYNILYTNDSIDGAANFLASKNIDIVALQEAKPEFVEQMKQKLGYEYSEVSDCDCDAEDTETGIVSKYPLSNTKTVIEHSNGIILRTEAQITADKKVAIYAVHIPPPFNQHWYLLRNDFTKKLTEVVQEDPLETIVMGDFNTTIFSPAAREFIDDNSTKITNISDRVWPSCSWFGYSVIACVRIDHIYVSNSFGIGRSYIGEGFGSDHRPIVVDLLIN